MSVNNTYTNEKTVTHSQIQRKRSGVGGKKEVTSGPVRKTRSKNHGGKGGKGQGQENLKDRHIPGKKKRAPEKKKEQGRGQYDARQCKNPQGGRDTRGLILKGGGSCKKERGGPHDLEDARLKKENGKEKGEGGRINRAQKRRTTVLLGPYKHKKGRRKKSAGADRMGEIGVYQ